MMKIYLVVILCLAFAGIGSAQVAERSDAEITAALLGTWEELASPASNQVVGESTYAQDGTVTGYTTPTTPAPGADALPTRIRVQARWQVDRGVLVVDRYETEPAGILPRGYRLKYEIVSITSDEIVFRVLGSRQELYRRRKKN